MKLYASIALILGLASCGDVALDNPSALSANVDGNTISGTFNPAGWTTQEIQTFIGSDCPGRDIASYRETPLENGLIAFVIECAQPVSFGQGAIEVQR